MKERIKQSFYNNRVCFVSAFFAGAFFLFACFYFKAYPFDDNYCLLYSDLAQQYYPMLTHLYDIIRSGKDIFYSWSSSFGYSFFGNLGNVSSPFNLIILLFNREDIAFSITIIILAKLMVIAFCFSYYLRKIFNYKGVFNIVPSLLYSVSGFFVAYYIHIMWLDSLYCLPIVIIGLHKLIDEKKPLLYIFTLTYMMILSCYNAYMLCLFLCVYFIYNYLQKNSIKQDLSSGFFKSKFFGSGLSFAGASVMSALLASVVLIPMLNMFRTTAATTDTFGSEIVLYYNPLRFLAQQFSGSSVVFHNAGDPKVPNCWSGLLTVVLIPAYLFSKSFSKKERIIDISLLAFMYLSLSLNLLSFVWCGFHFAHGFADRFAYFYIFAAVTIMAKALNNIEKIEKSVIIICAISAAVFITLMRLFDSSNTEKYTLIISLGFITIWLIIYFISWIKKMDIALLKLVVLFVLCMELVFSQLENLNFNSDKRDYDRYSDEFSSTYSLVVDSDNDFFFRTEACYPQNYLYPFLMNYNGITGFSSMIPKSVLENQMALGVSDNTYNCLTYFPQTPVYNSVFAIKYLIGETEKNSYDTEFQKAVDNGFFSAYKNEYYLPLGYCVNQSVAGFRSDVNANPFVMQNELFSSMCGVDPVFDCFEYDSIITNNATYSFEDSENVSGINKLTVKADNEEDSGYITFNYTLPDDGDYYLYITHDSKQKETKISYCGKEIDYYKTISDFYIEPNCIIPLGNGVKDGALSIEFVVNKKTETKPIAVCVASFDKETFVKGYNRLKKNILSLTEFENTHLKGNITAENDCVLFTSIPYDKGWTVKLDGKKLNNSDIVRFDEAFICVPLSRGDHFVEFRYFPYGMKTGAVVSSISALCLVLFLCLHNKKQKFLNKISTIDEE